MGSKREATGQAQRVYTRALELAQMLIAVPSYNPPGNERVIAEVVRDVLRPSEIEATLVPLDKDRCSLVARLKGRRRGSLVLCGHLDTVKAEESKWSTPPLKPHIQSGRLYGLGAADMKSGVALMLALAMELAEQRLLPPNDLVLLLTADEEVGYRGAASVAKSGLVDDAQMLLVLEPTGCEAYGGQKGELWLRAEFDGREAHGSIPECGVNAISLAVRLMETIETAVAELQPVPGRGRTDTPRVPRRLNYVDATVARAAAGC